MARNGGKGLALQRLRFYAEHGLLDAIPSRWQVFAGWFVMLPVTLSESPRERNASRQTWLGQVPIRGPLQVLFNPRQILVESGLSLTPEQVVRHVISVYHEDAFLGYDLQLLHSVGGLGLLRNEAERVVHQRTMWAPLLKRLVGKPGYHQRLIELADAAEGFEYPDIADLDPRFASLVGFARFCCTLPAWPEREFYGFDRERIVGDGW